MNELFVTQQRKVCELLPYEKNPRKITAKQRHELENRLGKYGMIGLPVLDADDTLIGGHQRLKVLIALGKGEDFIDVRTATRKLTDEEFKEVLVIENSHSATWDLEVLQREFSSAVDLDSFGIDFSELEKQLTDDVNQISDQQPELPIVAKMSEKYDAFIIVCNNEIDSNHVAELLNLDVQKSYKSGKTGMTKVVDAKHFFQVWKSSK